MESETPLVFGDGELNNNIARRPRPELVKITNRVIAVLEPLDVAARARVMRAVVALLGLD